MQKDLAAWGAHAIQKMGVCITAAQKQLKNQHASGPNTRATAKPGKNVLPHDGLNLEQQKCSHEDG